MTRSNLYVMCVLGISVLIANAAEAGVPVAVSVPVKCTGQISCGDDITLAQAKGSYLQDRSFETYSKCSILHMKLSGRMAFARRGLPANAAKTGQCSEPKPLLDGEYFCRPAAIGEGYFWAPLEKFREGQAAFSKLASAAQSGRLFNTHYQVVQAAGSTAGEQHLALCSVRAVKGVIGLPYECITVAIVTPTGTWLRGGAVPSGEMICTTAAYIRLTGAIDIRFEVDSKLGIQKFSDGIVKMLTGKLGLAAEADPERDERGQLISIAITSSAGLRNSKILPPGWREAIDFDVNVENESKNQIEIRGTAHALVSRTAVSDLDEYQGLSDAQRTTYANALNGDIKGAISAQCSNFVQKDDKSVVCN
jgi:hypothetical protein